jgi:hypothetical protein
MNDGPKRAKKILIYCLCLVKLVKIASTAKKGKANQTGKPEFVFFKCSYFHIVQFCLLVSCFLKWMDIECYFTVVSRGNRLRQVKRKCGGDGEDFTIIYRMPDQW